MLQIIIILEGYIEKAVDIQSKLRICSQFAFTLYFKIVSDFNLKFGKLKAPVEIRALGWGEWVRTIE